MNTDETPEQTIARQNGLIDKLRDNYAEVVRIHGQPLLPFKQSVSKKRQQTWALITKLIETNRRLCNAGSTNTAEIVKLKE